LAWRAGYATIDRGKRAILIAGETGKFRVRRDLMACRIGLAERPELLFGLSHLSGLAARKKVEQVLEDMRLTVASPH
jgi:hypothetical protein